jgi:hypothetical protein
MCSSRRRSRLLSDLTTVLPLAQAENSIEEKENKER